MSLKKKINRHRNLAMDCMKINSECRNSDWDLLITALFLNGINLTESQKHHIKHSGINYHTLLRERQKIQSEGLLLPTNPEVLKKRKLLQEEYTEHYSEN